MCLFKRKNSRLQKGRKLNREMEAICNKNGPRIVRGVMSLVDSHFVEPDRRPCQHKLFF